MHLEHAPHDSSQKRRLKSGSNIADQSALFSIRHSCTPLPFRLHPKRTSTVCSPYQLLSFPHLCTPTTPQTTHSSSNRQNPSPICLRPLRTEGIHERKKKRAPSQPRSPSPPIASRRTARWGNCLRSRIHVRGTMFFREHHFRRLGGGSVWLRYSWHGRTRCKVCCSARLGRWGGL